MTMIEEKSLSCSQGEPLGEGMLDQRRKEENAEYLITCLWRLSSLSCPCECLGQSTSQCCRNSTWTRGKRSNGEGDIYEKDWDYGVSQISTSRTYVYWPDYGRARACVPIHYPIVVRPISWASSSVLTAKLCPFST